MQPPHAISIDPLTFSPTDATIHPTVFSPFHRSASAELNWVLLEDGDGISEAGEKEKEKKTRGPEGFAGCVTDPKYRIR